MLSETVVRDQLARMLASSVFARSPRLRAFLEFTVEETLAGRGDSLKEPVIATELYGKRFGFDPGIDATVRVDARRLRDKLREYYAENPGDAVVISLPKGSYVSSFNGPPPATRPGVQALLLGRLALAFAVVCVGIAAVVALRPDSAQRFERIKISMLKFDHNGGELWTRQFGTHENDFARTAAVDANNVYVAGDRFLVKFEKTSEVPDASSPRISFGCVVNAASYLGGGVAPGEIVTIFGSGIGPAQLVTQRIGEDGRLATMLAETRILFNGDPAPLLFVSDNQSSAVVPYAVAGLASVNVQVEYNGTRSENVTVPVLRARPGIFTRDGRQAVALNEDGSVNSPANPAINGSIITLFATGEGLTSPRVPDGVILGSTPPRPASDVDVWFSVSEDEWPVAVQVLYAGGVSGSIAGLLQIQARVPRDVAPNDAMPVLLGVRFENDISGPPYVTPAVTVAVR